jgi:hypothetical protein
MDIGDKQMITVTGTIGKIAETMILALFFTGMSVILHAQESDSGWVPLFNGENFDGLYIRLGGGGTLQDPAVQTAYYIEDGMIKVDPSGGGGHIASKGVYSWYHVRIQYRFTAPTGNVNAGLLYHIHPTDYADGDQYGSQNSETPYWSQYVQSVECQMYRDHPAKGDAGAFLGIWNVWVTAETDGSSANVWESGGELYTAYPTQSLYPRRIENREDHSLTTDWNWLEAVVLGGDSVTHLVNGQVVMKGFDLETNDNLQLSEPDDPDRWPMEEGHIGLQAEGAEIFYRNFELRELIGCTDPEAANYVPWAVKEKEPSDCVAAVYGCLDTGYVEYNSSATVHRQDSCITVVVKGCMDAGYAEFDPEANVHDVAACVTGMRKRLYAIPDNTVFNVAQKTVSITGEGPHFLIIMNTHGRTVYSEKASDFHVYDFSHLNRAGIYILKLYSNEWLYVYRAVLNI